MIHVIDEQLRDEARRFRLVFACPECASFDPGDDPGDGGGALPIPGGRCSLGFPNEVHRDARLEGRDHVVFCKAFEAW